MDKQCWLIRNGWGDADYMDDEQEQADECRRLRGWATCPVHGQTPLIIKDKP
jgi:hypothetical protein